MDGCDRRISSARAMLKLKRGVAGVSPDPEGEVGEVGGNSKLNRPREFRVCAEGGSCMNSPGGWLWVGALCCH